MDSAFHNERSVIEGLRAAIKAGEADAKQKLGQRLLDGIVHDNWQSWRPVEDGYFLPFTSLDPANLLGEDLDRLCEQGIVSAVRERQICDGAILEGRELEGWRKIVVERAFAPECATFWAVIEVKHGSPRKAVYVGATFQDYDGAGITDLSFITAYSTYSETMNGLKTHGFTGWRDYQMRFSQLFAAT
jgi:hypothetical protein